MNFLKIKKILAACNIGLVIVFWIPLLVIMCIDYNPHDCCTFLDLFLISLAASSVFSGLFGVLGLMKNIKTLYIILSFMIFSLKNLVDYYFFHDTYFFLVISIVFLAFTVSSKFFSDIISYANQIFIINIFFILWDFAFMIINKLFPWNIYHVH